MTKLAAYLPSGKYVVIGVLNMDNVKGSWMPFPVNHCTNTSQIPSSSDHAEVAGFKFDEIKDL